MSAKVKGLRRSSCATNGLHRICGTPPRLISGSRRVSVSRARSGFFGVRRHREPGHRPSALGQQHSRAVRIRRLATCPTFLVSAISIEPLPWLLEHVGVRLELVLAGEPAGQRLALIADMLGQRGGRETECAGRHRFVAAAPRCSLVSSGVAARSIDSLPITKWRNGVSGARKPRLIALPRRSAASMNSGKVTQSQVTPLLSDVDRESPRRWPGPTPRFRASRACTARHPRRSCPSRPLVTPCQEVQLISGSQQICAS